VAGFLQRGVSVAQQVADALVVHHVGQAVGTQQQQVVMHEAVIARLQRHLGLHAQGAGDQVAVGRARRLCWGDQARVELLLQQRMVARQALQLSATQAVNPRVAHVAHHQVAAGHHQHHQRGAHAAVLRVAVGRVEDGAVGLVHRAAHGLSQLPRGGGGVAGQPLHHRRTDQGRGHAGGDFAGVVAAHAVGQHRHLGPGVQRDRILVVGSRPTHVQGAGEFQGHDGAAGIHELLGGLK
jgi:hypothetical protein